MKETEISVCGLVVSSLNYLFFDAFSDTPSLLRITMVQYQRTPLQLTFSLARELVLLKTSAGRKATPTS